MIEMSKERTTRRGRLLTTNHRDGRATYRLWHAKAHVAFLSLLYIIRLYSRINELVFIFVSHLHGQVVQTLVVLRLRDRAVFEEGFQGGHLPVVESPALFLWGRSLPRRLVRCVHRATILPLPVLYHAAASGSSTGSKSLDIRRKGALSCRFRL